ncbi:oligoribonuclease [Buchnera aphidicola (Ceratovacuna keduensis)]|uniref:oligoribonuclease n=1 Tax=Buchnera aphidicola TaxID=9 RepID=UPI0031B815CC
MKDKTLIWLDLEMTGLDPEKNFILEIGVIITDKYLNIKTKGISINIHQNKKILKKMDDWNKKTHKNSGLLKKVKKSKYNEKSAEKKIIKFIKKFVKKNKSPMCGNSNFIDKMFLKKFMPNLLNYFHYRTIDVSTIKEIFKIWKKEKYKKFKKKKNHTTIKDIKESIKELLYYKKKFLICK